MKLLVNSFITRTLSISILIVFSSLFLFGNAIAENRWIHVEGGNWAPTPEEFEYIKEHIKAYVSQQASAKGQTLQDWTSYTFQYQGQIEHGKEFIFINAFCIETDGRPLHQLMLFALDGGPCFFNVKYDPVATQFLNLSIHGDG